MDKLEDNPQPKTAFQFIGEYSDEDVPITDTYDDKTLTFPDLFLCGTINNQAGDRLLVVRSGRNEQQSRENADLRQYFWMATYNLLNSEIVHYEVSSSENIQDNEAFVSLRQEGINFTTETKSKDENAAPVSLTQTAQKLVWLQDGIEHNVDPYPRFS